MQTELERTKDQFTEGKVFLPNSAGSGITRWGVCDDFVLINLRSFQNRGIQLLVSTYGSIQLSVQYFIVRVDLLYKWQKIEIGYWKLVMSTEFSKVKYGRIYRTELLLITNNFTVFRAWVAQSVSAPAKRRDSGAFHHCGRFEFKSGSCWLPIGPYVGMSSCNLRMVVGFLLELHGFPPTIML